MTALWDPRDREEQIEPSPADGDESAARKLLEERLNELLRKRWCKELTRDEGVEPERVMIRSLELVEDLPATSALRASSRDMVRRNRDLASYKRWVTGGTVAATSAGAAAAGVLAAGAVLFPDVSVILWLLFFYCLLLAPLPVLYVRKKERKRQGLRDAPAAHSKASTDLDRRLRSLIGDAAREAVDLRFSAPADEEVTIEDASHLSSRALEGQRIATPSRATVELHLLRQGGAAVGLSGERGVGKSEVLRSFSDELAGRATVDDGGTVGVLVAVPSVLDGVQFLKLVLRRLASSVPGSEEIAAKRDRNARMRAVLFSLAGFMVLGLDLIWAQRGGATADLLYLLGSQSTERWQWAPIHLQAAFALLGLLILAVSWRMVTPLNERALLSALVAKKRIDKQGLRSARICVARDAANLLARIRYTETVKQASEGSLSVKALGLKRSRERSLSELPLTESDLVDEFRGLTESLAVVGYRVFVCVDEMDKLEDAESTQNFLNSVKQLFVVRSCSFLVSVSSSARVAFARRGVDLRDALDSSLDTVETVLPMNFVEARSLVRHRGEAMTDSQIALCFVMSGGLPRELLRAARHMAAVSRDLDDRRTLRAVASTYIQGEVARLVESSVQDAGRAGDPDAAGAVALELTAIGRTWRHTTRCQARADDVQWGPDVRDLIDRTQVFLRFYFLVEWYFVRSDSAFNRPISEIRTWLTDLAALRRGLESRTSLARDALERYENDLFGHAGGPEGGRSHLCCQKGHRDYLTLRSNGAGSGAVGPDREAADDA